MQKLVNKGKRELETNPALLFPVLKCEIPSTLGSLNQYKHKGSSIPSVSLYNLQDRNSELSTLPLLLLLSPLCCGPSACYLQFYYIVSVQCPTSVHTVDCSISREFKTNCSQTTTTSIHIAAVWDK